MTDGLVIRVEPDIDAITRALTKLFGSRLGVPTLEGDDVYFTVNTAQADITGPELMRILSVLDVGADRLRCHTLAPDDIRFIVDLSAVTQPEIPSLLLGERHP